jgi:hypothetical protein
LSPQDLQSVLAIVRLPVQDTLAVVACQDEESDNSV